MTNAEKIRTMTDEELALLLSTIGEGDALCHYMGKDFHTTCAHPDTNPCDLCVRAWLKSEV